MGQKFARGARPTPRHHLCAAMPHRLAGATPAQVAYVPSKLSYWLNEQDGDCVTAEEAFRCACSGVLIADQTVYTWASQHGVLNGADLLTVMQWMQTRGFSQDGNLYNCGKPLSVNYGDEPTLQNALALGPVKIGLDADAIPKTAGKQQGWYALGGRPGQYRNEDHCVALAGFGPADYLYGQLGYPVPAAIKASEFGYLLFTWCTIGFVTHDWIMSTVGEAWVRSPTAVIVGSGTPTADPPLNPTPGPPAPNPTPGPAPVPVPPSPQPFPVPAIWQSLLAYLAGLLQEYGTAAVPIIEKLVAMLPLPAVVIAAIDALIEQVLHYRVGLPYLRAD